METVMTDSGGLPTETVSDDGSEDLEAIGGLAADDDADDLDLDDTGEEAADDGVERHEFEYADGTKKSFTIEEARAEFKKGAMMQADYTKKTTELKQKVREAEARERRVFDWVGALQKADPAKSFRMLEKANVPVRQIVEARVQEIIAWSKMTQEQRQQAAFERERSEAREERENFERERKAHEAKQRAGVWANKLKTWFPEITKEAGMPDTQAVRSRIAQMAQRMRKNSNAPISRDLLLEAARAIRPDWDAEGAAHLGGVETLEDLKARLGPEKFAKLLGQAKQRPKLPPVTQPGARRPTERKPQSNAAFDADKFRDELHERFGR